MIYKIGICDGDSAACTSLQELICNYFNDSSDSVELYIWYTGESCCRDLSCGVSLHILFLEIVLPQKTGVEVGKCIREILKNDSLQIVYISSKTNDAMELFQVHPYDFLVKPITEKYLFAVLDKLVMLEKHGQRIYTYAIHRNIYKVALDEIQYFMSQNKHIIVYLSDGTTQQFRGKLKNEMSKLTPQFVMVGKSYIVHMKYIKSCHYDYIIMQNGTRINISQPYRAFFHEKFREY